jgi:hypothetical protein
MTESAISGTIAWFRVPREFGPRVGYVPIVIGFPFPSFSISPSDAIPSLLFQHLFFSADSPSIPQQSLINGLSQCQRPGWHTLPLTTAASDSRTPCETPGTTACTDEPGRRPQTDRTGLLPAFVVVPLGEAQESIGIRVRRHAAFHRLSLFNHGEPP